MENQKEIETIDGVKSVIFKQPRTKNLDLYVDLDMYIDDEFKGAYSAVKDDDITKDIYSDAVSGKFGNVSVAPSEHHEWLDNKWVEVIPKIDQISKAQAKIQLNRAGLYKQVDDWIKNSDDFEVQTAWSDSQYFSRNSKLILGFAKNLNLTDEQIDRLFYDANEIQL